MKCVSITTKIAIVLGVVYVCETYNFLKIRSCHART